MAEAMAMGTPPSYADNKNQPTQEQGKWYNKGYSEGHKDGWNAGERQALNKQIVQELSEALRTIRELKKFPSISDDFYIKIEAKVIEGMEAVRRTY